MRVATTSDLHGMLPESIPECDILIIAGDLCPDFRRDGEHYQQAKWLRLVFTNWLRDLPARKVIVIAGNHDFIWEYEWEKHKVMRRNDAFEYLEDSSTVFEGLTIHGSPWVPNLPGWAFFAEEAVIYNKLQKIPANVDVLVTHGPPFGILDRATRRVDAGSRSLRELVLDRKPKLHVFGHIHEAYGDVKMNGVQFANVARCTEVYKPTNEIKVFDLD